MKAFILNAITLIIYDKISSYITSVNKLVNLII